MNSCKKIVTFVIVGLLSFSAIKASADVDRLTRLEGKNRYETSVAVSKASFPESSKTVILAYGENFPDALSGAGLALVEKAPILLTDKYALSDSVAKEIKRLNPNKVFILGGTTVISSDIESQLKKNYRVERLWGSNRYETSKRINEYLNDYKTDYSVDVYVNAYNFPDALVASNILREYGKGSRIVLQESSTISSCQNNKGFVVGGQDALKIDSMPGNVSRVEGSNRYATSTKVLNDFDDKGSRLIFASGESFPDALSAISLAYVEDANIVLTDGKNVDNDMKNVALNQAKTSGYVIGGEKAISLDLEDEWEKILAGHYSKPALTYKRPRTTDTISTKTLEKIIKYSNKYKILPSYAITLLHYESLWGGSEVGIKDNNWGGMTWNGESIRRSGVRVRRGTPRPSDEGGYYIRYQSLDDFLNDWFFHMRDGGYYKVSGKSTFLEAVKGMFRFGGADYDYATMHVPSNDKNCNERRFNKYLVGLATRLKIIEDFNGSLAYCDAQITSFPVASPENNLIEIITAYNKIRVNGKDYSVDEPKEDLIVENPEDDGLETASFEDFSNDADVRVESLEDLIKFGALEDEDLKNELR